ncbi:MAG: 23S rRNA (pseudouridine(1915)-N(3))-methyltransferase RlmH [Acholeplasmataceae bacterium]|jgi:23S rRNA (pseudouridine1915-N3)-methyltransferase|nr:23S rRNA (pseudouridine(1915)-N(3))-methyltransferase RlmH [Acholeplasmataceae bacterium]
MIKIIAVGKMNQKSLLDQINYYVKQCPTKIEMIEVLDEASIQGMELEGERILSKIKDQDDVIALMIQGKMYSSEEFAELLDIKMTYQAKDIVFIIGGSYGLSEAVFKRANSTLSFSKMTFPHQLMRLILIEQIYRGLMILKHHPYHK